MTASLYWGHLLSEALWIRRKAIHLCVHSNYSIGSSCCTEDESAWKFQLLWYSVHVVFLTVEEDAEYALAKPFTKVSQCNSFILKTTFSFLTRGTRYGTPPTSVMRGLPHKPAGYTQSANEAHPHSYACFMKCFKLTKMHMHSFLITLVFLIGSYLWQETGRVLWWDSDTPQHSLELQQSWFPVLLVILQPNTFISAESHEHACTTLRLYIRAYRHAALLDLGRAAEPSRFCWCLP